MGKALLILVSVLVTGSFCFAQQPAVPDNETVSEPLELRTFEGEVALVYTETPVRNYPGRIEVVDDGGQRLVFIVSEATKVVGKNGEKVSLKGMKKGSGVTIEYTTDNKNHKLAKFIRSAE